MLTFENTKVGDKVLIDKISFFWFLDVIENAKKLKRNTEYTISEIIIASSWTGIKLKETDDLIYHLPWFKKKI